MLRLMDKREDAPTLPTRYYRQKAAGARQAAEEVTMGAVEERLQGLTRDFDRLADAADRAENTTEAPAGVIPRRR